MTRKFKENYDDEDIRDLFAIARSLLRQIKYYIENEELSEVNRQFLIESKKTIEELLRKYENENRIIDKISREQISFGFNEMYNNPIYQNLSPEECKKVYDNSSETLKMIKKDFEIMFKIEKTIHDLITIPLWKKTITDINTEIKPGDEFCFIVHAGEGIIYLPGFPNYKKTRNFDGDFVSASLLTNKQMAMFRNSRVGLILKANEAIVSATGLDSGTVIRTTQSLQTIIDFQNGIFVESGFPGRYLSKEEPIATTKIQAPNQVIEDTIKKQKKNGTFFSNSSGDVNEIVLDDSKIEVIGVFFKTNGCEINFEDFERAIIMEKLYGVPLKVVNSSIYRKEAGLDPYEEQDLQKFIEDIKFWGNVNNWKHLINTPEEDRELIKRYFNDVVVKQEYASEIRNKIEEVFTRLIEYTYNCRNTEKEEIDKNAKFYPSGLEE